MLDQSTRAAILKLREQGHSIRGIARAMKVSRGAVRDVLRSATEIVPTLVRPEKSRESLLDLIFGDISQWLPTREKLLERHLGFYYLWQ
jgi:transcriptional regulator